MSSQFHNRLVGTIVVVALGVIFLPDILDGKKERVQEEFAEIPLRPQSAGDKAPEAFEVLEVADTMTLGNSDSATPEQPKELEQEENGGWVLKETEQAQKPATQPEAKPKAKQETTARADKPAAKSPGWTLQLGSFRDAGNVQGLVEQLREAGFRAYTLPAKPVHGSLTKVFVGPDVSKAKVEKLLGEVEKLTKLKGRVVPFNPLES
ncbi:cell division protein DedD [Shewanella corallii]|uniref:Cell division protein DedD n=1 Tax=Shewanella corallii TaxID=560080 RepID=A0ABT0NAB4_9GAMM|nr:cell division protein DedD [Shewanella corallii]MCL2915381.1 cell division protein DedD [Shewanella corallii]